MSILRLNIFSSMFVCNMKHFLYFFNIYLLLLYVCIHVHMHEATCEIWVFPSRWVLGLDSGPPAWWQAPLPTILTGSQGSPLNMKSGYFFKTFSSNEVWIIALPSNDFGMFLRNTNDCHVKIVSSVICSNYYPYWCIYFSSRFLAPQSRLLCNLLHSLARDQL